MHLRPAKGNTRRSTWLRVREFAVPPSMVESATARRSVGDWAGACAAAQVDVDLDLRAVARVHGADLATRLRADLRRLAPDLLRWHLPRIEPDGLLRPGLTLSLARYDPAGHDGAGSVHLVARTPPAWADAGQRIALALWDGSRVRARPHPHPRPDRRFRLDLHRHLWDARRTGELRVRAGADPPILDGEPVAYQEPPAVPGVPGCAVDRWAAEAAILLRAEGRTAGPVLVRLTTRRRLLLDLAAEATGPPTMRITAVDARRAASPLPVLPAAATWVLPDLDLLRAGLIEADQLHPLVASALAPGRPPPAARRTPDEPGVRLVDCRGARHRIGPVDGVLAPWDHDPAEVRREELLATLGGTPLPCLQAIDQAHRHPECLVDVRARLDHGDVAGALAVVENLLGPDAVPRSGALRDELDTAALRRIRHGLFRAGLAGSVPGGPTARSRGGSRLRPTTTR